jgi:hypothetical protein
MNGKYYEWEQTLGLSAWGAAIRSWFQEKMWKKTYVALGKIMLAILAKL